MNIRIGTRGSKLALWQAYYVQEKLRAEGAETEIVLIETKGDKILDRALSKIGSKGVFTEELEEQLLLGEIDIAVHSAKDLQSDLGENFEIIAFTEREQVNDVLVSKNAHLQLNENSDFVVGTSSTRRVAMLKAYYPNLRIVDMRGNLQTRIRKMEEGVCDALLLAYAGVHRMEYDNLVVHTFPTEQFTPAVGQGSVAIEATKSVDGNKRSLIRKACNEVKTEQCLRIERAFLKEINGGCSIPVFGNVSNENGKLIFSAGIISLDGSDIVRVEERYIDSQTEEEFGTSMARNLLQMGGKRILDEIKQVI